jgi:hypothetical protein
MNPDLLTASPLTCKDGSGNHLFGATFTKCERRMRELEHSGGIGQALMSVVASHKKQTAFYNQEYYDLISEAGLADNTSAVDHPKHYNSHPSGIECIEIVRHHNFNTGNAIKYIWRNGLKGAEPDETDRARALAIQDIKKAIWYLSDEVKRLESK